MNAFSEKLISYSRQVRAGFKQIKNLRFSSMRKAFSLMGKREKIAFLILLALALLSLTWSIFAFYYSHTKPAPSAGGIYSESFVGQPMYINPLLAYEEPDLDLTKLVYSGLYKYDNSGQLVPDLAANMPTVSQDQKQYSIKLKNNVKWQNGKTFTANDVVFTFQILKDQAFKSPYRGSWLYTKVEKLGDYEVKFTTDDISGPFIYNLTLPIMPKSIWGNVASQNFLLSKYNLEAVGCGPYSIKEIKKLASGKVQSITLGANSDYFGDKAKISTIIFKFYDTEEDALNAFRSKEVNGTGFTPFSNNLQNDNDQSQSQVIKVPLPQYQVIFFNLNKPVFSDLKIRQALSAGVDKQKIISGVFNGNALLPSSPLLYSSQANSAMEAGGFDPESAKSILDQAGWTVDQASGIRMNKNQQLALTITSNDQEINAKAAEILAEQWKKLNINVTLNILPTKDLTEKIKSRDFEVLLFNQKFNADPDPFVFWHSSQIKDPGVNLTGYSNQEADKLIIEARTTTNEQVRREKYALFNKMISQNVPVIFLDQAEYIYLLNDEIKNVNLRVIYEAYQRFQDLPAWYIKTGRVWK
jgi:peptide/nickel transport system substrate-binding protein